MIIGWLLSVGGSAWAMGDESPAPMAGSRPKLYHSPKYGFMISKPDQWTLYTGEQSLRRECVGLVIEDSDEIQWQEGLAAIAKLEPLQPSGLLPEPFGPRVEIDVYKITAPLLEEEVARRVIDQLVTGLQREPDMYAQVITPPKDIVINGKRWRMVELSAKMSLLADDSDRPHEVHTHVECYAHGVDRKLFLAQFVARTFDVTNYRPDVEQILSSMTILKPSGLRSPVDDQPETLGEAVTTQAPVPPKPAEPPPRTKGLKARLWEWLRR